MSTEFTHLYMERVLEDDDGVFCKSELTIEMPVPIPEDEAQQSQEELWTWIIANFPGFIPVAYLTPQDKVNE